MQNQYVLVEKERIELSEANAKMLALKGKLEKCATWLGAELPPND